MSASSIPPRDIERWIGWVRLGAIPFAVFQVAISVGYPPGYERLAWTITALFAAGALALFAASRRELTERAYRLLGFAALLFDTAVISAYTLAYSFEPSTPIRQLLYLPVLEAALRYGMRGAVVLALATAPVIAVFEELSSSRADQPYDLSNVTFQVGVEVITALIVGWLVMRLRSATDVSVARAAEAEQLRDALGRRVDLLEAANRCARALGSSLDLEQAFQAFIRELRGLVPFDRTAIVLAEDGAARVIATAGEGADRVFPPGSSRPMAGSVLELVLRGETVYREDMADRRHPEEQELLELGLRCRFATPLLAGARAIGMLSVVRREPASFRPEEIELISLLGRLVATGVQNIRAYDAERKTVEELRRLSALRADFVSLVSHELRTPMAAVIGSARTLQQRWRELSAEQRDSFLALIGGETSRLADLIADVLDTSRIGRAKGPGKSLPGTGLGLFIARSIAEAHGGSLEVHSAPHQSRVRTRPRRRLRCRVSGGAGFARASV